MSINNALLFIDANKYLDLYRTKTGKWSLEALREQADHIFVTKTVVDEVKRNKIEQTAWFLSNHWELAKAQNLGVPDHLFGASEDQSKRIRRQMQDIRQKIKEVNTELQALATDIMTKVSQSTDEVSTALAPIFANAVCHSDEQLQKARERKERGDPPGKPNDPLGDQVTWEQILCHFDGKTKLWIITRDTDYGSSYDGKWFLNQFLRDELVRDELVKVSNGAEVFLFENVAEGIEHFAETTGVKADKLPTSAQVEEIKKEEQTLATPLQPGWIYTHQSAPLYDPLGRAVPNISLSLSSVLQSFDTLGRPIDTLGIPIDQAGKPSPNPGTNSQ